MAQIDDSHYQGADLYSDGDIEDEILAMVRSGTSPEELLRQDNRWPVLYHLAPERRNLLEWYPFRPEARLLEVGAGCGALTGLFCERVAEVQAVELSRRRSQIIYERHRQRDNLRIMVGNLADIRLTEKFDYIALIGVLEYAGAFMPGPDPYRQLLRRLAEMLQPDGVIFVALENKFGLKYFAGAAEDHTSRLFEGIEGYPGNGPARTFARNELEQLLQEAGLTRHTFYYPHPDYKLPREVFSDEFPPQPGHLLGAAPNYDHERLRLLNETRAWVNIIRAGQFPSFANSFLVTAGVTQPGATT
ncbi:MAG: class I SAM-dependent methyltransferase [Kiritimatiellia bacterium]|nr:class I SAM-dependent methyltransferase [Lentisphaerota bacterium]